MSTVRRGLLLRQKLHSHWGAADHPGRSTWAMCMLWREHSQTLLAVSDVTLTYDDNDPDSPGVV